jgi:general secretion pathway protein E
VDIGVEPFLISSAVIAVIAQRLIRMLCTHCKEAFTPDDMALKSVGITPDQVQSHILYRAKGCDKCVEGYRGRMGLFEIMVMDDDLKSLILRTYDSNRIKNEAIKQNMITLRQDGIQKVIDGITTIEEVLRVTQS